MDGDVGFSQIGAANTQLIIFVLPDKTHYFAWFSQNVNFNTLIKYLKNSINLNGRDKYKWLLEPARTNEELSYRILLELKNGPKEVKSSEFKKALSAFAKTGPYVKIIVERNEEACKLTPKIEIGNNKANTRKEKSI